MSEKVDNIMKELQDMADTPLHETVKKNDFEKAAKPLIKYLAENHHPHTKCIVDCTTAELVEGIKIIKTEEYLVD